MHTISAHKMSRTAITKCRWPTLTTAYGTQLPKLMATLSPFLIPSSRRPRANASLSRSNSRYSSCDEGVFTAVLPGTFRHMAANFSLMVSSNNTGYLVVNQNIKYSQRRQRTSVGPDRIARSCSGIPLGFQFRRGGILPLILRIVSRMGEIPPLM